MNGLFWFLLLFAALGVAFAVLMSWLISRRGNSGKLSFPKLPTSLETITQNKFARGLGIAVFLTAVYFLLLWLGYHFTAGALVRQLGTEKRWALLLVTVLGLPLIEVIWWLYKAAGIPGESKVIGRSFRAIAVFVLIFLGWWYHDQPNRSFNAESGKAIFYWAEKEGKPYFFDPGKKDVPKVYFSPVTGEKLRLGTSEDVEKFKKTSWLPRVVRGGKGLLSGPGVSVQVAAEETYTFPEGVKTITLPVDSTKFSGWVVTPAGSAVRVEVPGASWTERKFWDGAVTRATAAEGPKWRGTRRSIFRIRSNGDFATVSIE